MVPELYDTVMGGNSSHGTAVKSQRDYLLVVELRAKSLGLQGRPTAAAAAGAYAWCQCVPAAILVKIPVNQVLAGCCAHVCRSRTAPA